MKNVTNYILRSEGEEFAQTFKVSSITVINEVNRIQRAKVILLDGDVSKQDFKLSNMDFFKPGNTFEIDLGFESGLHNVFKGIIVRHGINIGSSNTSTLEIECKHKAVALTRNTRNHFYRDKSDKNIIEEILSGEGIDLTIRDWPEYNHDQIALCESSHWDFILSRTGANGQLVFTNGNGLLIAPPSLEPAEVLNCEYGRNVLEFEAMVNNEFQSFKIESRSWSPEGQEVLTTEGQPDFTNTLGNLTAGSLAAPWTDHIELLQHTGNIPEDELTAWGNAQATKNELAKVIGRVRVKGTHEPEPGKVIRLTGFGERFSGKALVTGVRHELQEGNWTTDIQFGISPAWFPPAVNGSGRPFSRLVPEIRGCHIAIVTQLENDPKSDFRVKVKIPVLDNQDEGIWARIAQPYAGNDYGYCFYPEIGDEVIVGFLNDDPRHAVILGSLHSSARPAPETARDENFLKGIYTASGLKLSFNDEDKVIEIATPSGNIIKLDEEGQNIKITDQHANSLEMKRDGIFMESNKDIRIKAMKDIELNGVNINLKASAKFSAEGNAGADLKSAAIAVLKGSLVQIN